MASKLHYWIIKIKESVEQSAVFEAETLPLSQYLNIHKYMNIF